jgi:hypothetical protein
MNDERITQALERLAEPPTDTTGVADSVIRRINEAPPPRPTARPRWFWVVVFLLAMIVAAVIGVALGSRRSGEDTLRSVEGAISAPVGGPAAVALYTCPGDGEVGTLRAGDRVGAVARSADGAWVAVRPLGGGAAEGWVARADIDLQGSVQALPEGSCDDADQLVIAPPGTEGAADEPATPSDGSADDTVTPDSTSPPRSTTTTTASSDTQGPSLALSLSEVKLWEADGGSIFCGSRPRTSQLRAQVSDPSGVAEVRATWTAGTYEGDRMLVGGALRTTTVGPHPYHSLPSQSDEVITVSVNARDERGNATTETIAFRLHSTDLCFQ